MKVLVLNGSPKEKSDTMVLTNAFLRGLQEATDVQVTIVDVIKKKIAPCRGCFGCWKMGTGECVIKDDQNDLLKLYMDSDLIIWSFPIYCYAMPSHLKAFLDRTIPLNQLKMVEIDGYTRHVPLVDFSKLHTVVISGSGFPNYKHNFEGLNLMCDYCFGNLTKIFVPQTPLMNVPEAQIVAKPKADRFYEAGKEYAKGYSLSKETIDDLQSLMISREEYLKNING